MRRIAAIAVEAGALGDGPAANLVEADLERLAELGLAFGPTTAIEAEFSETDSPRERASSRGRKRREPLHRTRIVWVDVSGCWHLHGETQRDGELALAAALSAAVEQLGYRGRVAIADGAQIAAAVARYASRSPSADGATMMPPLRVPVGAGAVALAILPLAALPLSLEAQTFLRQLGLQCVADLQRLPRAELAARLTVCGDATTTTRVLRLLDGEDDEPLSPYRVPEVAEERRELEEAIDGQEALLFVLKSLCDRLASRLRGRGVGASVLELHLRFDAAYLPVATPADQRSDDGSCGDQSDGVQGDGNEVAVHRLQLPTPLALAAQLLAVLRTHVESLTLPAPLLEVCLRAPELARQLPRTLSMFETPSRAEHALPLLVAELSTQLGAERVGVLSLADTWSPEQRSVLRPYAAVTLTSVATAADSATLALAPLQPTRRLATPLRLAAGAVRYAKHWWRLEGVQWWRGEDERRDQRLAWLSDAAGLAGAGLAGAGLAWVERRSSDPGGEWLLGWFD